MKRILMAIMAVAVAVTFSAPAFAEEKKKEEKKEGKVVVYGDEERRREKKGGYVDTFGDRRTRKRRWQVSATDAVCLIRQAYLESILKRPAISRSQASFLTPLIDPSSAPMLPWDHAHFTRTSEA